MKITTLVENTAGGDVKAVHGLSFYVETNRHRLLFDLGPDKTVFENADKLGVDLKAVDTVVISHGHYDHGGALRQFLELNQTAKVYIQRTAFLPHYSKVLLAKIDIGLDKKLMAHPQLVLLDGDCVIDEELSLFVSHVPDTFRSEANASLLSKDGPDDFRHEQNLLIRENSDVLFMGCAHSGVLSILQSVPDVRPKVCIGGFHIYNPAKRKTVSQSQLETLADALGAYDDIRFYTCHCTGKKGYDFLHERHANVMYIRCGTQLEL